MAHRNTLYRRSAIPLFENIFEWYKGKGGQVNEDN